MTMKDDEMMTVSSRASAVGASGSAKGASFSFARPTAEITLPSANATEVANILGAILGTSRAAVTLIVNREEGYY